MCTYDADPAAWMSCGAQGNVPLTWHSHLVFTGAGKTTTLSILAGRQRATSGAALVDGAPAGTPAARAALGYCPQVQSMGVPCIKCDTCCGEAAASRIALGSPILS